MSHVRPLDVLYNRKIACIQSTVPNTDNNIDENTDNTMTTDFTTDHDAETNRR